MTAFLSSSWTWLCGVAPYVGALGAVGLGGFLLAAGAMGWIAESKKQSDVRVQKMLAKPQGKAKVHSL